MLDDKLLKEFFQIGSLDKFNKYSSVTFSNGALAGKWFDENKDLIYKDKYPLNLSITNQHKVYLAIMTWRNLSEDVKEKRIVYAKSPLYPTILNNFLVLCEKFCFCDDLDKFSSKSKFYLDNNILMKDWFISNKDIIILLSGEIETCQKIMGDFKKYKSKEILEEHKKLLKDKLFFAEIKNPAKFSLDCNYRLPSNIFSGMWFLKNENNILSSDLSVDKKIKKQFENYVSYTNLRKLFLKETNLGKFNPDIFIRFPTGAIMSDWWEFNKHYILECRDEIDKKITKEWYTYLDDLIENDRENIQKTLKSKRSLQ